VKATARRLLLTLFSGWEGLAHLQGSHVFPYNTTLVQHVCIRVDPPLPPAGKVRKGPKEGAPALARLRAPRDWVRHLAVVKRSNEKEER
jgi:hypothetical protein